MNISKRTILLIVAVVSIAAISITIRESRRRAETPKIEAASAAFKALGSSLKAYRIHMGDYPSTEEGLLGLVRPSERRKERWNGPYFDAASVPIDPWGNPYQYRNPGTKNSTAYDLWSLGPDGVASGDDIGNWPK